MKIIKRYANRKLYDTEQSSYVTLDEIAEMVRAGEEIKIVDQKTHEDLTSVTLTQIIFEEEKRSKRILPLSALRTIIQSGGDFLQRISQPVQQFKEETTSAMDRFLRPGERLDDTRQAVRELMLGFQKTVDEMQRRVDERIKDAIDNLTHVPRIEEDLDSLGKRLAVIEQSLGISPPEVVRTEDQSQEPDEPDEPQSD